MIQDLLKRWYETLNTVLPEYASIALFFVCYLVISWCVEQLLKGERKKRILVLEEMDKTILPEYEKSADKGHPFRDQLRLLRYMSVYAKLEEEELDEVRKKGERVAKSVKARPVILLVGMIIKAAVFLVPLWFFSTMHAMAYSFWIPATAIILSVLPWLARKRYGFSAIALLLSILLYPKLSMEVNLFIALRWFHFIVVQCLGHIKK